MKKKYLVPLMVTLAASTALAGCSSSNTATDSGNGSTDKSAPKQDLKIAFLSEPSALDQSKATSEESFTMINMYGEGLYRLNKDGKPEPAMAADMPTISDNGKKYVIKIRDNATWSDGTKVTAKDFEYSWKRTLDPQTKSEYAFMPAMWITGADDYNTGKAKNADNVGIKAIDDTTLEVDLIAPVAFFTSQLAFPLFFPEKKEFVEKYGDKFGADADKLLANGPFLLKTWNHDQTLEFVKNDKYWDAKNVKLNNVTYQIVADQNTGLNLYETNNADVVEISRDQIPSWKDKPDYSVAPQLFTYDLRFNENGFAPFKNAKIRQAITMGIDRQAFVDTVLGNGSKPAVGYVPAGTANGNAEEFRKVVGDTQPKFNAEEAKKLLAEGLKELNLDKLPKFTMIGDDDETARKSIEFIQGALKQNLGVETDVQSMPKKLRLDKQTKGDFQMIAPSRWGADYNDPATFLDQWVTGGSFNTIGYSNTEYDKLVLDARKEADGKKRADMLANAEKILMKDMPIGPLYYLSRSYLKRPSLQDFVFEQQGPQYEMKWAYLK